MRVIGYLTSRWKSLGNEKQCEAEMYVKINNIEKLNKSKEAKCVDVEESQVIYQRFWRKNAGNRYSARDKIVKSVVPKLYGMYPLKLGYLLQMIGGCRIVDEGSMIRGDIHMLLVGDPGTGKSQFLLYTLELMPQSIITTGIGSTNAGLTAAASRVIFCNLTV